MPQLKITNDKITQDIVGTITEFPKYTTQLINLANQNAQGTRPKMVGQMSELIKEFPEKEYGDWVEWYSEQMPDAVDNATEKVYQMVQNLKEAIRKIDKDLVREWVKDLVLTKTFVGFCFQESILKRVAELKKVDYRTSTPEEESKGIDGYIGDVAVSIKPTTYKTKNMLGENIEVDMIYYEKLKDGIRISFDF